MILQEEHVKLRTRYQGRCERCGKDLPYWRAEFHHTNPFYNGGPTTAENLEIICRDCHLAAHGPGWKRGIGSHKLDEFLKAECLLHGTDHKITDY